jgi:hypothetical protein
MTNTTSDGRQEEGTLTPEIARTALIAMVESLPEDSLPGLTLHDLKTSSAVSLDANWISLGRWQCDLAKKNFNLIISSPPIYNQFGGEFKKTRGGAWEAVITNVTQS